MAVLKNAAINESRNEVNPADDTLRGLLIEEQRTNKCQNFNLNPDAALTNISASAGTLDRVNDAANIPFDGGTVGGNVFHLNNTTGSPVTITVTGTTGNTNAHSIRVFARFTGTAPTLQLTGAVGAVACANGYAETRSDNITPGATTNQWQLVVPNGTEVWFLGNQLEESLFASSPIETAGAAVTRAADNVTSAIVGTLPEEWSVVFEGMTGPALVILRRIAWNYNDGTANNSIELIRYQNQSFVEVFVGGTTVLTQLTIGGTIPEMSPMKVALAVASPGVRVSVNGNAVQTISLSVASGTFTTRMIGRSHVSINKHWNGWIKNIVEYPRALSDAELIAESTL